MASWRKTVGLGLLVWFVPFIVAILAAPLKESWRSLFESIMSLTLAFTVVCCSAVYFRWVEVVSIREGMRLGLLWFVISVGIDLPLMLGPPLHYPLVEYGADIALTYLMIPAITVGMAVCAGMNRPARETG
jgi:hypothetical protein